MKMRCESLIYDSAYLSPSQFEIGVDIEKKGMYFFAFAKGEKTMEKVLQRYDNFLCGEYSKKNTIKNKMSSVRSFLEYVDCVVSNKSILNWRHHINGNYRHNTVNLKIQRVNEFLVWYGKPEFKMKLIGFKDTNKKALSENDFEWLIQYIDNAEMRLIFWLLFDGILRPSELINIRLSNRKDDVLYLDDTKTGDNKIILSQEVIDAWDDYLKVRPKPKHGFEDFLLIQKDYMYRGQKYAYTHAISKKIKKLAGKSGLNQVVTSYTIKRTAITLRFDKSSKFFVGNPKIIRNMARHKDLKTTLKYDCSGDDDIRRVFREERKYLSGNLNDLSGNLDDLSRKRKDLSY